MNRDRDAVRARRRAERPFLRVEKLGDEFAVYNVRDPHGVYVAHGFATQEQAEECIAQYDDDNHVAAELRCLDDIGRDAG